jgi:uncharacterized protein (DUF433 family)
LEAEMKNDFMERIFSHPDLRAGEPCIKGTRIPVSMLVASFAEGLTRQDILREYPQLKDEDITAALLHASEAVH